VKIFYGLGWLALMVVGKSYYEKFN